MSLGAACLPLNGSKMSRGRAELNQGRNPGSDKPHLIQNESCSPPTRGWGSWWCCRAQDLPPQPGDPSLCRAAGLQAQEDGVVLLVGSSSWP